MLLPTMNAVNMRVAGVVAFYMVAALTVST